MEITTKAGLPPWVMICLSFVDLASMSDPDDDDGQDPLLQYVDHPPIANPQPVPLDPRQLLHVVVSEFATVRYPCAPSFSTGEAASRTPIGAFVLRPRFRSRLARSARTGGRRNFPSTFPAHSVNPRLLRSSLASL